MPRKKKTETKVDAVPTPSNVTTVSEEQTGKFVVLRSGFRVSDAEYDNPTDPAALTERDYWVRVSKSARDGSKVEIVPFVKKLHRTY